MSAGCSPSPRMTLCSVSALAQPTSGDYAVARWTMGFSCAFRKASLSRRTQAAWPGTRRGCSPKRRSAGTTSGNACADLLPGTGTDRNASMYASGPRQSRRDPGGRRSERPARDDPDHPIHRGRRHLAPGSTAPLVSEAAPSPRLEVSAGSRTDCVCISGTVAPTPVLRSGSAAGSHPPTAGRGGRIHAQSSLVNLLDGRGGDDVGRTGHYLTPPRSEPTAAIAY